MPRLEQVQFPDERPCGITTDSSCAQFAKQVGALSLQSGQTHLALGEFTTLGQHDDLGVAIPTFDARPVAIQHVGSSGRNNRKKFCR